MTKQDLIVKAYVHYAGMPRFDDKIFKQFVGEFPELLREFPKAQLRQMIVHGAAAFRDEIDPLIDINEIRKNVGRENTELEYFFNHAPTRLKAFIDHFKTFPFKSASNKSIVKKSILTVYGEDVQNPESTMNKNLDKELSDILNSDATNQATTPETPKTPNTSDILDTSETLDTKNTSETTLGEDIKPEGESTAESLPPEIEDEAVATLNGYLQKDVFNNKLIPVVKIVEAWKLQNGYIVTFELSSLDKSKKVYASAVVYNDKLVLPAELRDENDQVVGEFNKDTILNVFAEAESEMPTDSDNYQDLMSEMIKTRSPAKASKILDKIIQKFGAEVGRNAFDTFTRVKYKKTSAAPIRSADLLDIKFASDLPDLEFEETMDPDTKKIMDNLRRKK